jgi:NADH-quinone oxidoreductase subunit H
VGILLFCFIWLRGTLPRIRYDQLMRFGWKVLIPVSLVWILVIATIRVWRTHGGSPAVYTVGGLLVVALLVLLFMGDAAMQRRSAAADRLAGEAGLPAGAGGAPAGTGLAGTGLAGTGLAGTGLAGTGPAVAGAGGTADGGPGFPVPPMDLPHYHGVGVNVSTTGRTTQGPGDTSAASGSAASNRAAANGTTKEVTGA